METNNNVVRVSVPSLGKHYPVFMTAEKASRFIGVSRPTVMRMIERGDIEARKSSTSNVWMVKTTSVCQFLNLDCEVVDVDLV